MIIDKNYVLRTVADEHIVVPTGEAGIHFNGVISLNGSGKLLFETLQQGATKEELIQLLLDTYDIDHQTATNDVTTFLTTLRNNKILSDD